MSRNSESENHKDSRPKRVCTGLTVNAPRLTQDSRRVTHHSSRVLQVGEACQNLWRGASPLLYLMATGGCAMLTTLLESRSRRVRDTRGTATSVTLHAAIIFAAIYATATASVPRDNPFNPPALQYITIPPASAPAATARLGKTSHTSSSVPLTRSQIAVDIPTAIPSIDIPLAPV